MLTNLQIVITGTLLLLIALGVSECKDGDADCSNGTCTCPPGMDCDFTCAFPPCHVECEENSYCDGECGNGDCICSQGATCYFACETGPCHVTCEGNNPICNGECENGTCVCGSGSVCDFTCLDSSCHTHCEGNAECSLTCPLNTPGTQGCIIDTCGSGEAVICPDNLTIVCGKDCPIN